MAKVFIVGRAAPIAVSREEALHLKDDWVGQRLPKQVEIAGEVFRSRDIRGISGAYDIKEKKKYDLDNPDDVKIIRQFEKDFLDWYKANPEHHDELTTVEYFFESKGGCDVRGPRIVDSVIINPDLYTELGNKWSALQSLRRRREIAKGFEKEYFDRLVNSQSEKVQKKL